MAAGPGEGLISPVIPVVQYHFHILLRLSPVWFRCLTVWMWSARDWRFWRRCCDWF